MITSPQTTPLSTPRDPAIEDLQNLILNARLPGPVVACERLKGDASNRTYFRLHFRPGSQPQTVVLMQLAEPEAFKRSEEAVSGGASTNELPFLNVQRYLIERGVAVPVIHAYDIAAGQLLLEDLGDCTLFDAVTGAGPERIAALYHQAIDELVTLQSPEANPDPQRCLALTRKFDHALLMWEFDHFLEYGIEARNGIAVPSAPREAIRRAFSRLSEELAAAPVVFVHRDYHSRNLMLTGDRLRVIDFQDALTGPQTYDLASLLRDSYVTLDQDLINRLIAYYMSVAPGPKLDPAAFQRLFDITAFQRNLKAAGRFIYIEKVKGRATHLPYVTPTLRSARRVFTTHDDLAELRDVLVPYVPEFS